MRARSIAASLIFATALGAGAMWVGRSQSASPSLAPVTRPTPGVRLFEQVYSAIASQYVDTVPVDTLYQKAVSGLLSELKDPYTSFLPEERMRRLSEQMSGNYGGVGLTIDRRDGWFTVIDPIPGSPAERAGVQPGDRIVAVNEESTRDLTTEEVADRLRGTPGSPVTFTVERLGSPRFPVTVERESVSLRAVPRVAMMRDQVGYVDVNLFGSTTVDELRSAIDSLMKMGATGVLLDLRGNPGGLLEQGVAVAEMFLNPGQSIVELRGRPGREPERIVASQPQAWPGLALAVLVDAGSASAAEIVAGALQDHDRAAIVGRTSFGKGSAQTVYPMASGGALRLTTARWYTPLGRSISQVAEPSARERAEASFVEADTTRPQFATPLGRTVLGGGGIVPDISIEDTLHSNMMQQLAAELGGRSRRYRNAISALALELKQRNAFVSPDDPVTREVLEELFVDLEQRDVPVTRRTFNNAGAWIARTLGYEVTRLTFGRDAEFQRRALDDATIMRAVKLLAGARSPSEPFARIDATKLEVADARE